MLVTHLAKTLNFIKYYVVSVSTFCSLKVISAIENSILGHNYITSRGKKTVPAKDYRSNYEIAINQNISQCSHHLLNSVHSMYRAYTYFDESCIILYIPHIPTKC
jgi:hypothetical protein